MEINDVVIMIPAYNPDKKFMIFLKDLIDAGYKKIIVIDDGSKEDNKIFFKVAEERFGCSIVSHSINLGQGRAYKSGFNYYLSNIMSGGQYTNTLGIIQCDCDGQHHIDDVNKCVELLRYYPNKFILGIRNFSDKGIPFRSRIGNICTNFIFKFFCGLDVSDTQTGLKGIPASFIPVLMETPGERFEYASSVLLETKKQGIEIVSFPIRTIYINKNETSHFNPLLDSIRIYSLILKYLLSSLSSFIVDIVLYSVFISAFRGIYGVYYVVIATYLAKIFSCTYGYLINSNLVFNNNEKSIITKVKFFALCVIQATISGFITRNIVLISGWNEVLCKIIIDTFLFFTSFQIQNRWVFKNAGIKMKEIK